jgi:hypothetical protein
MTAIVKARKLWNKTGIRVTAGVTYCFKAEGCWVDFYILHGPAGDPSPNFYMRWFEHLRRMNDQNWFTLIGAIDEEMATAFPIGKGGQFVMTRSGELTCFANDVKGFYWNNWGHVTLTVHPVTPA